MDEFDLLVHRAFHEAGHAVAASRRGFDSSSATVTPGEGFDGRVVVDDHDSSGNLTDNLLVLCSGYAALVAAGRSEAEATRGCDSDFKRAQALIDSSGCVGDLAHWKRAAVALMGQPVNRQAVEHVAEHLCDHRTMPGDLIDLAIEVADGTCPRLEFDVKAEEVRRELARHPNE